MTVFALAGTKGGGGKSTVAINLACELQRRGGRVLIIDTDPQHTAVTWSAMAQQAGNEIPGVTYIHPDTITQQVPQLSEGYDHVVLDTAGRMDSGQRGALMVADVVIYPLAPSVVDVWALAEPMRSLREIQAMQEANGAYVVRATAVINRRQAGTVVAKQVREAAEGMGLSVIGTLNQRVGYAEAFAAGIDVCGYAPSSSAASEVRTLVDDLLELAVADDAQAVA